MNIQAPMIAPHEVKVLNKGVQFCIVRYSPCGRFLVAGGYDGLVHRWGLSGDEMTELPPLTGHGGWVQCAAFDPIGGLLFTADSWGQLRAWDMRAEPPAPKWTVMAAHDGWIYALAASLNGALVATCGLDGYVRTWSAADGSKKHEHSEHKANVLCLAIDPLGTALVSGDLDGCLIHFDFATGQVARRLDVAQMHKSDRLQEVGGPRTLAFDAAGQFLACGGTRPSVGGNVQGVPIVLVFDWAQGTLLHTLELGVDADV